VGGALGGRTPHFSQKKRVMSPQLSLEKLLKINHRLF
jgi:hypothetical protein